MTIACGPLLSVQFFFSSFLFCFSFFSFGNQITAVRQWLSFSLHNIVQSVATVSCSVAHNISELWFTFKTIFFFFTVHVSPTDHENSFHTLLLKCIKKFIVAFHCFPCFASVLYQFDHRVLNMRTLVDLEKVDKLSLRQNNKNILNYNTFQ